MSTMITPQLVRDAWEVIPLKPVLILLTLLYLAYWFLIRRPRNIPPGPVFVIPGSRPHELLTKLSHKFGSVFSLRFGPILAVIINDEESFHESYGKRGDALLDRNVPPLLKLCTPTEGSFTFGEGEGWHHLRKFGNIALRHFGVGQKIIIKRINEESRFLAQEIDKYNGKPFDPLPLTLTAIANIMNVMVFGTRYEYTDHKYTAMMKNLIGVADFIKITDLVNFIPFLYWTRLYKPHREYIANLKNFIEDVIEEHRKTYDPNNIRDIVDMYLDELNKEGYGMLPHDSSLVWRGVYDLFGASTETTNLSMNWLILYLGYHPEVQRKMQEQIDSVLGRDRQPTLEDRDSLPWVLATVTETFRIRPPVPLTQRGASSEFKVNGYTIPKGATVIGNIWAIHHDPAKFPNPSKFDPTRFLTPEGKFKNHSSIVAFGLGRRMCMGKTLAETELFLFTANLMQHFTIKFPEDQREPDLSGHIGMAFSTLPYRACFVRR